MKRRLTPLLALLLIVVLTGCSKSGTTLPPLDALSALPETRLSEAVKGYSRDSLILGWGEPERSMQGNLGDTWNLDTERELTVLYDEYGKVFAARVRKP